MKTITENCKVQRAITGATAGTGTTEGDIIDTAGFDTVAFVGAAMGTANAGNYVKVQQDSAAAMGTAADLEGTKVTPGDNGDAALVEIIRPGERYIRLVAVRGASSTLGDAYAILGRANKGAVTHGTTIDSEIHISPAEGTA